MKKVELIEASTIDIIDAEINHYLARSGNFLVDAKVIRLAAPALALIIVDTEREE